MPRKPPKLSTDDLHTIIDGKCGDVTALEQWAIDELKRRERAGKLGGRPKGKKPKHDDRVDYGFDTGA